MIATACSSGFAWLNCHRRRRSIAGNPKPIHNHAENHIGEGAMKQDPVRRHGLSRRTMLAGTAGLMGAAGLAPKSASAQQNAKLGTPASVITNPPREWAARPSVDLSRSRRHRRRSVVQSGAARDRRYPSGVDRSIVGGRAGLVEPGAISRLQRRRGQHPIPLHLGRPAGDCHSAARPTTATAILSISRAASCRPRISFAAWCAGSMTAR